MVFENFIRPFWDIRRNEFGRVLLTFLYFNLTIASYYIVKTCSRAFFINRLGADLIPYVYIANAVLMGVLVYFYSYIAHKKSLHNLVNGSLIALIITTVMFWWGFQFDTKWLPFVFWIWVTFYSAISVTQFWTVTNDIFDKHEATRVYGIVGAGGLIGGVIGSYLSASLANVIGTRHLLLIAVALLVACVGIVAYLSRTDSGRKRFASAKEANVDDEERVHLKTGVIRLISKSKYLVYLLLVVFLIKFCSTLTEWQYNKVVDIFIKPEGEDATASFVGKIFGHLSTVALFIQIFFTPFFLKRFGGGGTLLLLPGGLILAEVFLFLSPGILTGSLLKITDGSLRYSINQSAKEYVYLPMSRFVRRKIKPFIDMFIYQFAKGFAALFILFSNNFLFDHVLKRFPDVTEQMKVLLIGGFVLPALFLWLLVVTLLKKTKEMQHPRQSLADVEEEEMRSKELRSEGID